MIKTWKDRKQNYACDRPVEAVMQAEIDELRAELARLKQQEPVAFMDSDQEIIHSKEKDPQYGYTARYTTPLYLAPGAQPHYEEQPDGSVIPVDPSEMCAPPVPEINFFDAQRIANEYGLVYNRFCAAHKAMLEAAKETK